MSDDEETGETGERERPGDSEGLIKRLRDWESAARAQQSGWQRKARHWYDFTSGEQWSADDKAKLLEEMRVPITFNRVDPMVSAVMGAEVLNRQSVQYYPREIGDSQASEMLGAAADWVRDNCDAEDEESDAFSDLVICGMGWTETTMSYDAEPEGEILVNRVDPLDMGWDPSAKKRNLADARYVFRVREYDRDDFKVKFPGKFEEVIGQKEASAGGSGDSEPEVITAGDQYKFGLGDRGTQNKKVRVVQMQWWDLEPAFAVQDPQSGQVRDLKPDQMQQMIMMHLSAGMAPPQVAKGMRRAYKQAIYAGTTLIEEKELPCGFALNCMTGKRERNTNTWYGVVKAMVDPQMWANKWLSQLLHIVNSNAKGGLLYETGSFPNQRRAEDDWGRPDAMIEVTPGVIAGGKIRERQPGAIPPGLQALMEFSIESLPQVSGINLEMLGLVQREQAGVLEAQRKRSGYAILAVFFDALRRYRKIQGRVLLEHIQRYISDGRLIRIKGSGDAQYVPLVRQPGVTKYDIVVDEAPMSANQKEAVWGMLVQMMPMLKEMAMAPDVIAKMIEYSPLPSSLSAQIAKSITQPQPNPEADMQKQMAVADAQANIGNKQANAALTQARTQREVVETQLLPVDRARTLMVAK